MTPPGWMAWSIRGPPARGCADRAEAGGAVTASDMGTSSLAIVDAGPG